jgi:hypothetical protein
MEIKQEYRKVLVEEFAYAAKMMKENQFAELKLFYFSSTYGALSRIFNLQYDPQLIFMHLVLNNAYGNINTRIQAIKGGEGIIQFPEEYFEKLTGYVEKLASQIERNEDTYKTLEEIALLTFLTTGNGFYLFQKGILKI